MLWGIEEERVPVETTAGEGGKREWSREKERKKEKERDRKRTLPNMMSV